MQAHAASFQDASNGRAPMAMMGGQAQNNSSRPSPAGRNGGSSLHGAAAPCSPGRLLPSKELRSDSIEDDYVQFIFYCNPSLSLDLDTAELRRGFQSMPKTDGKSFDVFVLFELIQKLEAKEIETWSQLVVDMGVVPPNVASGQSTQKVQQYAVRLKSPVVGHFPPPLFSYSTVGRDKRLIEDKLFHGADLQQPLQSRLTHITQRWLHAYHIDAFFQYCLGRSNAYFADIPAGSEMDPAILRDGVPPEEDLALRALLPEWRPKRGRRRNDEYGASPSAKRQLRAASLTADDKGSAEPTSAYPQSASPWDRPSNQRDPWAAAHRAIAPRPNQAQQAPTPPQSSAFDSGQLNFFVGLNDPATQQQQHPQSAISSRPPSSAFPSITPQSAHPTTFSKAKKRHGPYVSAAWANDGSSSKIRGRPSATRTVQDGPFSTFPAKPSPAAELSTPTSANPGSGSSLGRTSPTAARRPSKLQLQVPQHSGGPIRLATPPPPPPPKLVLNGTDGGADMERRTSAEFFNTLDEEASEIMADSDEDTVANDDAVDWKKRAMALRRKVQDLEAELKGVKRRVLEAVM